MKLLIYITLISGLFSQSIDNIDNKKFIESLVQDLNKQKNNAVLKKIADSNISETQFNNHVDVIKLKALYNLKEFDEAIKIAAKMNYNAFSPNLKTTYHISLGDIYGAKNYYDLSFEHYLQAHKSNIDTRFKNKINKRIAKLIPLNLDYDLLELEYITEENEVNKNIILLAQVFSLSLNNSPYVNDKFQLINPSNLEREFKSYYNFLKKNIDSKNTFSKKIGVVLPLSSKALEASNAFLKGLIEANSLSKQRDKIQYIVIDNNQDPIDTIKAFKDLVSKHKVSAIIGPFSDENLIAGAGAISNINIPIFSPFSTLKDVTMVNKNIYLLKPSIDFKNQQLVNHAFKNSDLNNIAIIAPRSDEGIREVDSFLTAMDKLNKEPIYIGWYDENNVIDLRPNFKELRDIAWDIENKNEYQEFLGVNIDVLDSMFDVDNNEVYDLFDIEEEEAIDSTKVILETIHAIFYPVNNNSLEFIASQISLSNLKTQLMGNENWLKLDLLKQENISPHISNMLFTTSYIPKYISKNEFEYDGTLNNAFHYGFDFSNFLISNFLNGKNTFDSLNGFEGITRNFNFSSSNSNISPRIIRFSNNKIYNAN